MTEEEFVRRILESLFIRGYTFPCMSHISDYAGQTWNTCGPNADPGSFADHCIQCNIAIREPVGDPPSFASTVGARDRWIAIHEAGHAIVGMNASLYLVGVRFYGDVGDRGAALFEDFAWQSSMDEDSLRQHIRVDVAGNVAELLYPGCPEERGGRLSHLYDNRSSGLRSTDFCWADGKAARMVFSVEEWDGNLPAPAGNWDSRRAILAQAEAEAERVLQDHREALERLADQLMLGPMTGTAVREIVEG